MDRLTRFPVGAGQVELVSKAGNTLDTLVDKTKDVEMELKLTRRGHEAWDWGEEVEDSDEIDLSDFILEDENG